MLRYTLSPPYTGAWIETWYPVDNRLWIMSPPYTGAWIETF